MAARELPRGQHEDSVPERGSAEWRIRRVEIYLYRLALLQLVTLNVAGIFWIAWSDGIKARKRSSLFWVLLVHGLLVAGLAWVACVYLLDFALPEVKVIGYPLASIEWLTGIPGFAASMILIVILGWPIRELTRPEVRAEFYEADDQP